MDAETHTLMDGKLHVYKRENSRYWQCSTYLGALNHRASTKEESLVEAKDFARGWYMERCVEERRRRRAGEAESDTTEQPAVEVVPSLDRRRRQKPIGPLFKDAAAIFLKEYQVITEGERNQEYVDQKSLKVRLHLLPFFGDKPVAEVSAGLIQDYRVHRQTSRLNPKTGEPRRPARSTLHSEMVTLRQILKAANRKGWIGGLPDMSVAYKSSGKISHRAWFSPDEYKMLYEATRERSKHPKKERWRSACEQMHDFVLFMGNTGLRPDEALRLEDRDIAVVRDEGNGERILEITVRGKRGTGYCMSMPGAVHPYQRIRQRKRLKPADRLFDSSQRELFNNILDELDLKRDREGSVRTAYSLRHTYICMRLMEGADIYQIAKNCRTSVEMIEKYYASHIKNTLDTAAINVRRAKVKLVAAQAA
ncbi:MAG: integrase [Nevskia sp.]|nr:integrase [Nevskia sp.]